MYDLSRYCAIFRKQSTNTGHGGSVHRTAPPSLFGTMKKRAEKAIEGPLTHVRDGIERERGRRRRRRRGTSRRKRRNKGEKKEREWQ